MNQNSKLDRHESATYLRDRQNAYEKFDQKTEDTKLKKK